MRGELRACRQVARYLCALLLCSLAISIAPQAVTAQSRCAQPLSSGSAPTASDCLFILRVAVGSDVCDPDCICAPKGTLPTTATDALICLKKAVGQDVSLNCPCVPVTTTTLPQMFDCAEFIRKFGAERLVEPHGLAIDAAGNLYVADSGADAVFKFSSNGSFVRQWGGQGTAPGQFVDPRGISAGPANSIYVADNGNLRVQQFDSDGNFVRAWGSYCFMAQGTGCVDPDGAGPLELGDGQFVEPYGIAAGPDGSVYVADSSNRRIQKFDATGAFLTKWGGNGVDMGFPDSFVPRAVAAAADGSVYASNGQHAILHFDADGVLLEEFGGFCRVADGAGCVDPDGAGPLALGDGQLFQFLGLLGTVPGGDLLVADDGNARVQRLGSHGGFRAKWGSDCFLSDPIGCIDPDGAGPLELGDGQFATPAGMAAASTDKVYAVDVFNRRVQQFRCSPADL